MHQIYRKPRNSPLGGAAATAIGGFIVLALLITFAFTIKRWEGQAPRVTFDRDFTALGRTPSLSLKVEDPESGLRHVIIRLKQKDQEVVLADDTFDHSAAAKSRTYDLGTLIASKAKTESGPASLQVVAVDNAVRNFLRGNRTDVSRDFAFQVQPPRVEVLSGQHYINQGGSECVVYRLSGDAQVSGVQVGS